MSRIGKKIIHIPAGVKVAIDGNRISVTGPKGELERVLSDSFIIEKVNESITIKPKTQGRRSDISALWGLYRALVFNMVKGVVDGFSKILEIHGVGYRARLEGRKIVFNLGFSHPVELTIPDGIDAKVAENKIEVSGANKELVGQIAANIRKLRKPEPYKGKGIRYQGEYIKIRVGKKAAAATA